MDASEYKHVCLGLIFLKYISDSFEEKREQLLFGFSDPKSDWFIKDEPQCAEAAENRDEYLAANVFWLPPEARWHTIKAKAKSPGIGKVIDDAMGAIERENPTLKGVLPRDYARPSLDKVRLGGLVDIISNIGFNDSAAKSKDVLGRVYEYFLGKFASAEGKGGGEFYTPQSVVQLLVAMLEPYKGRVYDPACGSGGMFVQSEKFVEEHGGSIGDIAIYGQACKYISDNEQHYITFRKGESTWKFHSDSETHGDSVRGEHLQGVYLNARPKFKTVDESFAADLFFRASHSVREAIAKEEGRKKQLGAEGALPMVSIVTQKELPPSSGGDEPEEKQSEGVELLNFDPSRHHRRDILKRTSQLLSVFFGLTLVMVGEDERS